MCARVRPPLTAPSRPHPPIPRLARLWMQPAASTRVCRARHSEPLAWACAAAPCMVRCVWFWECITQHLRRGRRWRKPDKPTECKALGVRHCPPFQYQRGREKRRRARVRGNADHVLSAVLWPRACRFTQRGWLMFEEAVALESLRRRAAHDEPPRSRIDQPTHPCKRSSRLAITSPESHCALYIY